QASAPFTQLTFVFNEDIDPASFTTAAVAQFTGPGGVNLTNQVTGVSGSGNTFTVQFNAQASQGTYTLEISPVVRDVAGTLLDQNGNGTGGEPGDRYVATVDLQSPDLTVTAVQGPASARFGDTVSVTWTVRNAGSDPAAEHWGDRVYLSRDTTLDAS